MTEDSDLLRERRVVVITSSLSRGYNELWDAVQPHVGEMTVVGARPPDAERENAPVARRVELRAVDLGRGLVWQHLIGLRRLLSDLRPDLVYVNRELWTVVAQEVVDADTAVVAVRRREPLAPRRSRRAGHPRPPGDPRGSTHPRLRQLEPCRRGAHRAPPRRPRPPAVRTLVLPAVVPRRRTTSSAGTRPPATGSRCC